MLRRITWRMQKRLSTSRPCSGEEGRQSYPIIFSLILPHLSHSLPSYSIPSLLWVLPQQEMSPRAHRCCELPG